MQASLARSTIVSSVCNACQVLKHYATVVSYIFVPSLDDSQPWDLRLLLAQLMWLAERMWQTVLPEVEFQTPPT